MSHVPAPLYSRDMTASDVFAEFQWRGLLYESTEGLRDVLARDKVTLYIGFDPTAASLHVGSSAADDGAGADAAFRPQPDCHRRRRHGMIGDPSGKTAERQLLTVEKIDDNVRGIRGAALQGARLRRPGQSGPYRQQRRLAAVVEPARLPARHRQTLHRQLHAGEGVGAPPSRAGRRHLVHRVQLPDVAGVRLPGAVRPAQVHAADGRQRPVGQHHSRVRPDPEAAGGQGARPGDAAGDHLVRREVRQDRSRGGVARPGADLAVQVLPVLAEHGRPGRAEVPAVLHVPGPGRPSRRSKTNWCARRSGAKRLGRWRAK